MVLVQILNSIGSVLRWKSNTRKVTTFTANNTTNWQQYREANRQFRLLLCYPMNPLCTPLFFLIILHMFFGAGLVSRAQPG